MRTIVLILLAAAISGVSSPADLSGCAMAPPKGGSVGVNSEEAIIAYDAATKTEHFIRRADFRTDVKDFGFLAPTPSKPELGEAESSVFDDLQRLTAPRYEFSGVVKKVPAYGGMAAESRAPTSAPRILDRKQVAGYDAVVLQADDLEGLKKWLEDNHYDARPAAMEWLKWYVEHHWVITAFKIAVNEAATSIRWSKAVRMSFETASPFYPYREPEDMRTPDPMPGGPVSRKLRIYLLADARYEGALGSAGSSWAGKTVWSNVCPREKTAQVVKAFGTAPKEGDSLAAKSWHLTEFEDNSSPRPGTDEVYFRRAADQAALERPVILFDRYEYIYDDPSLSHEERKELGFDDGIARAFLPGAAAIVLVVAVGAFLIVRRRRRTE